MATYIELMAQAKALMEQAESVRKNEKAEAISFIRSKMKEFGVTPADLRVTGSLKPKGSAGKSDRPARFRGPDGQLWSGLGRHPDWLRQEVARGRKAADFAI